MESFLATLANVWHFVAGLLTVLLAIIASAHVVLFKRDSRAAVGWVGLIWLAPVVGAVLYVLFGINRIRRRAAEQRLLRAAVSGEFELPRLRGGITLPAETSHLSPLAKLVDRVTGRTLTSGNVVTPLSNGEQAYPEMINAIDRATRSVALCTFIFDNDSAGRLFVDALERAVKRGVTVRVLIDAVGARYSLPSIVKEFKRRGIPVARFGRALLPWRMPYGNLRNHRKVLVVDGNHGFTGGMNIRTGHVLDPPPRHPVQDLHFHLEGPVVAHMMQTFAEDWTFTTGEVIDRQPWFPLLTPAGSVAARDINDGPDADFEKAQFVYLGALACAQRSVRIVTPYFLPDSGLITALNIAAMRGVRVEIILPEANNQLLVKWASVAQFCQLLNRGCHIYYTPSPFDHTKLMLVDDGWALIGSSNWDARSLRLNFEFNVECYDKGLATALGKSVDAKLETARVVTTDEVNGRSLPVKLRDGIVRLAAPYL